MRGLATAGLLDVARRRIRPMPDAHYALLCRAYARKHGSETAKLATTRRRPPRGYYRGMLFREGYTGTYSTYQEQAAAEVLKAPHLQEETPSCIPYPCSPIGIGYSRGLTTILDQRRMDGKRAVGAGGDSHRWASTRDDDSRRPYARGRGRRGRAFNRGGQRHRRRGGGSSSSR